MKRKFLTKRAKRASAVLCGIVFAVLFAAMLTPYAHAAQTIQDWQNQLENKNNQKQQIESELNQSKKDLAAVQEELNALDRKIYAAQVEINELIREQNETKEAIVRGLEELERLRRDIEKQNDELNARLRSMYKYGDVGLLSVVFGSNSMSDALTNMDMVQRIYKADADLLASIQAQYDLVDEQNRKLEALKQQLETQQAEIEAKKAALVADEQEAEVRRRELQSNTEALAAQYEAVEKEAEAITATIKLLQSANTEYIGGSMCWPSETSVRITSPYGPRKLFGYTFHTGVDIGAKKGTNILAANSGKVIKAGYNASYGNMVIIDHGGGVTTLYAHASKLLVKTGDAVARGQVIALIGSTGQSTGPHLHFEVRINGSHKNPLDGYISPSVRK